MDIWDKVFTGRPIKILTISFQIFKDCLPQILLGPLLNTLSLLSRLMLWLQFWLHFLWFIFENRKATENFFFRETRGKGLLSFFSCTFNFAGSIRCFISEDLLSSIRKKCASNAKKYGKPFNSQAKCKSFYTFPGLKEYFPADIFFWKLTKETLKQVVKYVQS